MNLFKKPAQMAPALLKWGIYGDPGSGKTLTATKIAIGLGLRIGEKTKKRPPIFFLDTETGSKWVGPIVEQAGLEFLSAQTRSFKDLIAATKEAEEAGAIQIIDSVSHYWEEVNTSFLSAKRERIGNPNARMELPDWAVLKGEWARFTTLFLNSQHHIILCGRAGSVYETQERDDGRKEMIAAGTRMAAEKGMGYEPDLLMEMTQRQVLARKGKPKTIARQATIIKDRADLIDGHVFMDPTFENFLPYIEKMNIGGAHVGIDTTRSSRELFNLGEDGRDIRPAQRRAKLGDIQDLLVLHIPGQTAVEKQRKVALLRKHFNAGWAEMEELMPLERLRAGYESLKAELEPAPAIDDEIPHMEPTNVSDNSVNEVPQAVANSNEADRGVQQPSGALDKEAGEAALNGFKAALDGAHTQNKITRVWNTWTAAREKCDPLIQAEFLKLKAEAMKRVKEAVAA